MSLERTGRWLSVAVGALMAGALLWSLRRILGAAPLDQQIGILAWMALLLPLAGFIVLSAFGSWFRRDREEAGAAALACGIVLGSCALSVLLLATFAPHEAKLTGDLHAHAEFLRAQGVATESGEQSLGKVGRTLEFVPSLGDWIVVGGLHVPMRLLIDRLSLLMMLIVTGIGALIHIYSLGYMARDPERVRYFSYLNLFTFFMLLLVMSGSLPLLFVGWEGVGLCSYLLIGFWFKRPSAAAAGFKAFLVNRIGDAGLLLGILLAWGVYGTVDIVRLVEPPAGGGVARMGLLPIVDAAPAEMLGAFGPLTVMALLFFIGACGKSAQVPLHVWLPDAMEGPTPVSALIHAATMVTAGVYLVARLSPLYVKAPTALAVVAVVGLVTALMAGTVALVQTDVKRVLAYSTVSQLGFMFLACGAGCFGAAIFHLFTHAFFKALLFLGAGAVIHALGGEQDMRRMGGLWRRLPWTFWTFVAGAAAIAGVPLLSGYMSKEAILAGTLAAGHPWLTGLALVAAALTAVYMTRLVCLTFFGSFRGSMAGVIHESPLRENEACAHIHEAPWVMRVPLILLALGALGAGYIGVPRLIAPVLASGPLAEGAHAVWLAPLAIALAVGAIVATAYLYLEFIEVVAQLRARFALVARVLEAKWGFDLAFDWVARRVVVDGSTALLWRRVDTGLIDAAVNGTARLVDALAARTRGLETGLVRQYALVLFGGTVLLLVYLVWR